MQSVSTSPGIPRFHRRHKHAVLLATLLLLILLSPLIQTFKDSHLLVMLLTTVVMATAVNALSFRNRSAVFFAAGLATLAIISGWMQAAFADNDFHRILSHSFGAALYIYIATLLFKVILIEDEVTVDQIFAAVAIYIFIGLTWGHFYALVGVFDPESVIGITVAESFSDSDFIYFSFVTLTTLGYGDMLPVNPMTKALVIIEAITGVMFVAILISTLVGRVNMKR